MVGHVRQSVTSVRRMAKRTLKEFEELSEVSNTEPNARILSMVVSQNNHVLCFASRRFSHQPRCGLYEVVATFWLSVFASVFAPVS